MKKVCVFLIVMILFTYAAIDKVSGVGELIIYRPLSEIITKAFESAVTHNSFMKGMANIPQMATFINMMIPKSIGDWEQMKNLYGTYCFDERNNKRYGVDFIRFEYWKRDWSEILHDLLSTYEIHSELKDLFKSIRIPASDSDTAMLQNSEPVCFIIVTIPKKADRPISCSMVQGTKTIQGKKAGLIYVFKTKNAFERLVYLYIGQICITREMSVDDLKRISEKTLLEYRLKQKQKFIDFLIDSEF